LWRAWLWKQLLFLSFKKATTLCPGGIWSCDRKLQSSRWQAETIPIENNYLQIMIKRRFAPKNGTTLNSISHD
jgi:hypothetical protein